MSERAEPILLVDDNPTNLQVLYHTLDGRGYRLLVAKSGEQAVAIARRARPVVVLLDIMMPGIDGFETCRRLQQAEETRDTSIIFLSALDDTHNKVKGFELGAVDYIAKPFDAEEVIARVATHVRLRQLERRLSEGNRRMRLDLEAAARVQQSLLPQAPPRIDGVGFAWRYTPCEEMAGDSLNLRLFDERRIGLYVLDVSGHGVSSSLLAVSVTHALAGQGRDTSLLQEADGRIVPPAEVAARLNRLFPMDHRARLYFTFLYGVLDCSDGRFEFVSAGNPGPLVRRADGTTEVHDAPAVPIGFFADSEYQNSEIRLAPGDRMFLHSDGLSEERNPAGEELGRERLQQTLSAQQGIDLPGSIDGLVQAAQQWSGTDRLRDDLAVLAIEIEPEGGGGGG